MKCEIFRGINIVDLEIEINTFIELGSFSVKHVLQSESYIVNSSTGDEVWNLTISVWYEENV